MPTDTAWIARNPLGEIVAIRESEESARNAVRTYQNVHLFTFEERPLASKSDVLMLMRADELVKETAKPNPNRHAQSEIMREMVAIRNQSAVRHADRRHHVPR